MTKTFLLRRSSNLHRLLSALKTSRGTIDRFFNFTDAIILRVFFSSRRCSELPCVQAWRCSYRRKRTWRLFCPHLLCCWCFYPHLDLAAAQVDVVDHHVPPHLQQISRSSKMKEAPLFKHLSKINRSSSYIKGSLSLIDQKIMRINIKHQTSRSKDLHTLPSPTPSPFSNLSCSSLFIRGRLEALWDLFSSFRGFVLGWDGMDIIGHRSSKGIWRFYMFICLESVIETHIITLANMQNSLHIWKNCTESKISPLALRSSTRRASSSSDINFENKLNETEEEAFNQEQETSLYPQLHHIAFQDTQISNISYSLFSSIPMQERHSCFEIFRSESWSQYLDTEGFWCHLYLNVEKHLARVF